MNRKNKNDPRLVDLNIVTRCAMTGANVDQVATILNVDTDRLLQLPELLSSWEIAIECGQQKGIELIEAALYRKAARGNRQAIRFLQMQERCHEST